MYLLKDELKTILLGTGLVREKDYAAADEESVRTKIDVIDILIGRGVISEQFLAESIGTALKIPFVNLDKVDLNPEVLEAVPEGYAKNKSVILFDVNRGKGIGKLAMVDPLDFDTLNYLQARLEIELEPHMTTLASLRQALKKYKSKIKEDFNRLIEENIEKSLREGGAQGNIAEAVKALPVISVLDNIIEHAITLGASDIHLEPMPEYFLVRYRIDGILREILSLPKEIGPIIVARIKVIAQLQIDVHHLPQDGRFRFPHESHFVDVRVSVVPAFHGEKAEMRLLKGSFRPLTLYELGISSENLDAVANGLKASHGMILVTGPTGSGKTTTLYSMIGILNTPQVNITTIEDPVEYDMPRVNQMQVNVKAGLTFATGLRSIVRQNPDIIMVGEIRDKETVDIAIHAALTGHLLLSTLHTNDAPSTIPRLIDMGGQPFLVSSALRLVIAQRLVRKNCSFCISSYDITEEAKKSLRDNARIVGIKSFEMPTLLYRGKGCHACNHTGYRDQIGIFEVLNVTDTIKELLLKQSPAGVIRDAAQKEGMKTMFEDGLQKVEAGTTTMEEVLRVISE